MSSYALFDDAGKFHAGRLMSEADASVQIELDSGKRVKVKSANLLLRFAKPEPVALMAAAQALAAEIDLEMAWEFSPEGEFGFADLARDYFSANAGPEQQAAMLFKLFEAPHYFRRAGKGLFKKAPEETVKAALLGIERKAAQTALIETWATELAAGQCPPPVREQLFRILFKPDKNGAEYKAVVEAAKRAQRAPLDLLQAAGAIDSPYQFHWKRFLFEQFAKGTGFPALSAPGIKDELPLAAVQAFSIDDSQTTEIDDALSVTGLGQGTVIFGVHIAAPALAFGPDSAIDKLARERLSTVYMPGHKITMLPDEVVQAYTLIEGRDCPAVSLYVTFDEATLAVQKTETRIERVPIAANLRHDQLDEVVTVASLTGDAVAEYLFAQELAFSFRLAKHLKAQREVVRGKPENFNRPDYNFKLDPPPGRADQAGGGEPLGDETVRISERKRGAPLDLIVSEAMILANSHWGGFIAEVGVPGIYRSQASMAPGVKVRMGTRPAPHAGMGVAQYSWATSPLRRYVDLVNQWQIIACARHGRTAALVAPFKPKDASLFSVISLFDTAYAAYNDFQRDIERFWTLRWLQQNEVSELDAVVLKDGLVRADTLPLVFKTMGCEALPRNTRVRVRITGIDLLTLDLHARLAARLDEPASLAAAGAGADNNSADDSADDDDALAATPLTLAFDLGDAAPDSSGAAAAAGDAGADVAAPRRSAGLIPDMAWRGFSPLQWALGLSLALHGGLLGFHFADPAGFDRVFRDTPLEVILVNARSGDVPLQAQALAQAALAGGGELASGRSTSPLPATAQVEMGNASDEAHRKVDQLQDQQQQLLAQIRREMALLPPPDPQRDNGTRSERDQEERRRQLLKLLAEIEKRINEESARPRKRYISPATREVAYALYYDKLRRRIEERGTRNFPEAQGKKLYGELTMNITVDAAGRLLESEVVRGSGNKLLDARAVGIVRGAAPFGGFSSAMRRQADQIVVTSRFRFTHEDGLETVLSNADRGPPR